MDFNNQEWLEQVREPIVDPDREIVDPHHHLWEREQSTYLVDALWRDTGSGHRVVQTVYVECRSAYDSDGPAYLRPVGETRWVSSLARQTAAAADRDKQARISAIVAHANLADPHLDQVLDAHEAAGQGLFRGIRHAGARDPNPGALRIPGLGGVRQYDDDDFRAGVARLGERGLTYDTWHFHHQNRSYCELAKSAPGTVLVLDHLGTPLGVGEYAGKRESIFAQWKDDLAAIAECPNVVAKLGGMAMPDNGFGWESRTLPPTSDEFVEAQARYYHHMIDCFGPDRCMFESNFPVDRVSISYHVLFNGLKKIAAAYPEDAQRSMFSETARRVYRL